MGRNGSVTSRRRTVYVDRASCGELEKITSNIEQGKAPFDQQQALTLEFYESRIGKLEKQIDELKDRIVNQHYEAMNGKNGH